MECVRRSNDGFEDGRLGIVLSHSDIVHGVSAAGATTGAA